MRSIVCRLRILSMFAASLFFAGCAFRRATVSTRHFILSPISTNESPAVATAPLPIGIGFVKMPTYLLRDSMLVRTGANEIEYLEDASWSERFDQCFQQTLAANLSRLLPSDNVYLTDWSRDRVKVGVFINVEQFDVDTSGRGTLIAGWRIIAPNSDIPLKSGRFRVEEAGASPRGHPEVIARTLSHLEFEFSADLAQSIHQAARASP